MRYGDVYDIIKRHTSFYRDSLPLIASENITSKFVRCCYLSDLGHRYAEGKIGERFYEGCSFIDEIEQITVDLMKDLLNAPHVNVQPISGVVANMAGFFALTKPGDKIMVLSIPSGGHISHEKYSAAGLRGLKIIHYPFDNERMNIDIDKTEKIAEKEEPALFVLGASLFLFPHPVREIHEIAERIEAKVLYDGSHVLGLITGGEFQQPIDEGADVLTASTHKTFFGPQRAIIACKDYLKDKIDNAVFPGVVSNHHLNTLAGLAISAMEMKLYGKDYAIQTIKNAKKLAETLAELGLKVLGEDYGYTESHQIAVDVRDYGRGAKVAKKLESINVIINKNLLPWDTIKETNNPSGIRIGVQEVTRLGMKEREMEEIAEIIYNGIIGKDTQLNLKKRVVRLKRRFTKIKYTFEEHEAYSFLPC